LNKLMRPAIICLLLLLTFAHQHAFSQPNRAPLVIRVGAIYYDDSDAQYAAINDILSALEKQSKARAITFKLAVGTYEEIMNWYESDQIDLAIMNPGPLALLID